MKIETDEDHKNLSNIIGLLFRAFEKIAQLHDCSQINVHAGNLDPKYLLPVGYTEAPKSKNKLNSCLFKKELVLAN